MCSLFSLQLKLHLSLTANTANPLFVKMASSFTVDQKTGTIIPPLKKYECVSSYTYFNIYPVWNKSFFAIFSYSTHLLSHLEQLVLEPILISPKQQSDKTGRDITSPSFGMCKILLEGANEWKKMGRRSII
jgi:hypothetical protein